MTGANAAWRDALGDLVRQAPDELRRLASDELHIGGFTNVRLAHPVLDLREVVDDTLGSGAVAFFTAAALLRGATVARVHVRREHAATLPRRAKRDLRGVLARVDADSASLLLYFDLYLRPVAEVRADAGRRLVNLVATALTHAAPGAP